MPESPDTEIFFSHSDRRRGLLIRTRHLSGKVFVTEVLKRGRALHHYESCGEAAATRMHIEVVLSAEFGQLPTHITPP